MCLHVMNGQSYLMYGVYLSGNHRNGLTVTLRHCNIEAVFQIFSHCKVLSNTHHGCHGNGSVLQAPSQRSNPKRSTPRSTGQDYSVMKKSKVY